MKILQLGFQNLNSLAGQWQLDFTDPAFAGEGIFAITGPTGAGKSSILDAICLALYGCTPRLGRITKSSNEIMSRQTGECFAEVTFATSAGSFRCHWGQHRARRKPEGELQQPRHELVNAQTGEVLASKLRDVEEQVVALTGMDFERFTRSVLLAQGGFAAFLQAGADARAPILEQITGTEIYSRISRRVHEEQRAQQEQLRVLEAKLEGIQLLSAEDEQQLDAALAADSLLEQQCAAAHAQLEQELRREQELQQLQQDIKRLHEQLQTLDKQRVAFAPQRSQLAQALRAVELEAPLAALNALRSEQAGNQRLLEQEQQALPSLQAAVQQAVAAGRQHEQQLQQARESSQAAMPLLKQVRALDVQLEQQEQQLVTTQQDVEREQQRAEDSAAAADRQQQLLAQYQQQQQELADWLQQHATDQSLVSGLTGIEQQLLQLRQYQARTEQLEKQHSMARAALQQAQRKLEQEREHWKTSQQQLRQGEIELAAAQQQLDSLLDGRPLEDYQREHGHLLDKRTLLTRIESLEKQRNQLQSGQPCPLCGAIEHPYTKGQLPQMDELAVEIAALEQRINQITQQEKECHRQELRNQQLLAAFASMEAAGQALAAEVAMQQQAVETGVQQLDEYREHQSALQQRIQQQLEPLGVTLDDQLDHLDDLLAQLQQRQMHWQNQQDAHRQLDSRLAAVQADIKQLQERSSQHRQQWQAQQSKLQAQQQAHAELQQQREQLYGSKQPDAEEQSLQQAEGQATQLLEQQRKQQHHQEQQLVTAQDRIRQLEQRLQQQDAALRQQQDNLHQSLAEQGFADEAALQAAVLPASQRQALQQQAGQLDEAQTRLTARLEDSRERLQDRQPEQESKHSLEQLQEDCTHSNKALQEVRDRLSTLRYRQAENNKAKNSRQAQQEELLARQQECRHWDALHALIGSADGKKFRNFAQGLTFELMVAHANQTLQKMTDRYLLVRDQTEPLELNVLDSYQAGTIRSTKNLSGGESFIVSLALALGLSRMSSQNVRVDSLFLDEGFGTLDEEALDVALDTLSGLQEDGKLIGVISHVPALKERIATQIVVQPVRGGRSRLSGPGCSQPLSDTKG